MARQIIVSSFGERGFYGSVMTASPRSRQMSLACGSVQSASGNEVERRQGCRNGFENRSRHLDEIFTNCPHGGLSAVRYAEFA